MEIWYRDFDGGGGGGGGDDDDNADDGRRRGAMYKGSVHQLLPVGLRVRYDCDGSFSRIPREDYGDLLRRRRQQPLLPTHALLQTARGDDEPKIGDRVLKYFRGFGRFEGTIVSMRLQQQQQQRPQEEEQDEEEEEQQQQAETDVLYRVQYDDGDAEVHAEGSAGASSLPPTTRPPLRGWCRGARQRSIRVRWRRLRVQEEEHAEDSGGQQEGHRHCEYCSLAMAARVLDLSTTTISEVARGKGGPRLTSP